MSANNSTRQTLFIAAILCLVCSIVVSSAAVILKPQQVANKLLDRNKNILSAAGLFDEDKHSDADVASLFAQFEPVFLDLREGKLLSIDEAKGLNLDANTFDQKAASKVPELSRKLSSEEDTALIGRQAKYALIYLLKEEGELKRMVLPVHGYGLWGTLYGFMAVENDANTIAGLAFYSHKETPGLGAKVDLPKWKALWPGKKIYEIKDDQLNVRIKLTKGQANPDNSYEVDGLSGATLTSVGVSNLVQFWMGDLGYKPFMASFTKQNVGGQ
ncbi:MAG: Na(+)-translocating NADH-quinone reductase subunit C [Pseudomonadota bacterium]